MRCYSYLPNCQTNNRFKTHCCPQGTLLNVMWQPGWEGFGGEGIHVYVWLSPFIIHLKLSQHY